MTRQEPPHRDDGLDFFFFPPILAAYCLSRVISQGHGRLDCAHSPVVGDLGYEDQHVLRVFDFMLWRIFSTYRASRTGLAIAPHTLHT